jgi:hypothetical protein
MGRDPVSETILFLNTNNRQIPETKYSLKVLKELSIVYVCVWVEFLKLEGSSAEQC